MSKIGEGGEIFRPLSGSLPVFQAILIVPFWLSKAPRPMGPEDRRELFGKAASRLNGWWPELMEWDVLDLDWSPQPHLTSHPKVWHPKTVVTRKGAILRGKFAIQETLDADLEASRFSNVEIVERRCYITITESALLNMYSNLDNCLAPSPLSIG